MRALLALAVLLAGPAAAQVSYPPADAEAVRSMLPPTCSDPPAQDTVGGTVGSLPPCIHPADAASRTVIQAKNTTTDANAAWSVTFDMPFAAVPIYVDARVQGSPQPHLCTVLAASPTGASGKCFQLVSTTIPSTVAAVLGLLISPIQPVGAGLSVRVVARQ